LKRNLKATRGQRWLLKVLGLGENRRGAQGSILVMKMKSLNNKLPPIILTAASSPCNAASPTTTAAFLEAIAAHVRKLIKNEIN